MKKAATILALLIKGAIFYFIVIFGINQYDLSKEPYLQNPLVWITLYLPIFMGYETLLGIILSKGKD
jgi:hypothetical protein